MATVNELIVKLGLDANKFKKGIDSAQSKLKTLSRETQNLQKALKPGAVAIAGLGAAFVKTASDAEEIQAKFDTVFGEASKDVEAWAKTVADRTGRSSTDLKEFSAALGDTFKPLGFATDQAADFSKQMVELAVDLASFNNLRTEDVVRDLQSAIVGNTETLRKFGVVANQAAIEQKALELGLIDTKDQLDAQSKAAAILAITMEGTTDAQGDAQRTAGSFANQMRALGAEIKDVAITIGKDLLPTAKKLVSGLRIMAQGVLKTVGAFKRLKNESELEKVQFDIGRNIDLLKTLKKTVGENSELFKKTRQQTERLREREAQLLGDQSELLDDLIAQEEKLTSLLVPQVQNSLETKNNMDGQADAAERIAASMKKVSDIGDIKIDLDAGQMDAIAMEDFAFDMPKDFESSMGRIADTMDAQRKEQQEIAKDNNERRMQAFEAGAQLLGQSIQVGMGKSEMVSALNQQIKQTEQQLAMLESDAEFQKKTHDEQKQERDALLEKIDMLRRDVTAAGDNTELGISTISGVATTVTSFLAPQFAGIVGALGGPLLDAMVNAPEQIGNMIADLVDGITTVIIKLAENLDVIIISLVEALPTILFNVLGALFKTLGELLKAAFVELPKKLAVAIAKAIKEIFNKIKDGFKKIGSGLKKAFTFGRRAEGGPVSPGRAFVVGEKGPELLVPDRRGFVIPADQSAAMMNGGGITANIVIQADKNPNVTAQMVHDALIRLGNRGQLKVNPVTGQTR